MILDDRPDQVGGRALPKTLGAPGCVPTGPSRAAAGAPSVGDAAVREADRPGAGGSGRLEAVRLGYAPSAPGRVPGAAERGDGIAADIPGARRPRTGRAGRPRRPRRTPGGRRRPPRRTPPRSFGRSPSTDAARRRTARPAGCSSGWCRTAGRRRCLTEPANQNHIG